MRDSVRKLLWQGSGPGITTLVGVGFAVIPPIESYTLAYVAWAIAAFWALYVLWPTLKRWRPLALAPVQTDRQGENVQPPTKPDFVELKARCLHLGKDVETFDDSRRGVPGNVREDEIRRRDEETMRLYHDRLKPRIMKLYDELAPGDWFDDSDRELFENVSEWHQLEDVAARLKIVGERLPEG